MRRHLIALFTAFLLLIAGCEYNGMSPRETRGRDYATYVFSMYDPDKIDASATAKPLQAPTKVAVAQIGELAPPLDVIKSLRHDRDAFASVQPISGQIDADPRRDNSLRPLDHSTQQTAQTHADRMRRLARDIGADYLFLYGGTVDGSTTTGRGSVANLTIIGAFLIPGDVIDARVCVSGALIDVETGRMVLSVSADSRGRKNSPRVAVDADEIKLVEKLRNEAVVKLAEQLRTQVKEQSAG